MATYNYKKTSLIALVNVTSPRPSLTQATLVAAPQADGVQLEELRKELGRLGYSTLMDSQAGRATIQVRGLKDEKSFIEALEKLDLSHDGVAKDLEPTSRKQESFSERMRGKSLFLSALFYDLGNVSLGVSGVQRGRHNPGGTFTKNDISEIMTGAAFAVGDVLMTYYGKDRGDEELDAAANGLKKHLHQKGIEIPKGDALNPDSLHRSGMMKAADRWLRKHIGHVKCLTELTGGLFMIHSGLKRDRLTGNNNRFKIAAGSLIAVAWASTFLLEKPRGDSILDGNGQDGDAHTPGLIEKIKDNPRAWVAAPLAMGNNLFNLMGANKERRDGLTSIAAAEGAVRLSATTESREHLKFAQAKQHDYLWNVLTACSFLVAHSLFGLSGMKRPQATEDDNMITNDLVLLSANVLANQPDNVRETSIEETADYVSKLAHVGLNQNQVADAIRDKIHSLNHSTWAARTQAQPEAGLQTGV